MEPKPTSAAGYEPAAAQAASAATLYIATKLGDLRDEIVIVGGLVPNLLIPPGTLPAERPPHVGTLDVDLGIAIGILNSQRYRELCERLRSAGFRPDVNAAGRPTNQRWRIAIGARPVTVDFLIPATSANDPGGALLNLEAGFAAIITPGLELAFADKRLVTITGETLLHERASREVWVCEAGAFTVLKALAFQGRGENKDAYDLIYVLQNYGVRIDDIFRRLQPLLSNPFVERAIQILDNDFAEIDRAGPMRVAAFLGEPQDETIRADAAGVARALVQRCRTPS